MAISFEHGKLAYWADYVFYGGTLLGLTAVLGALAPRDGAYEQAACALVGFVAWTLLEYIIHRWILHGVPPFDRPHGDHHDRPMALLSTPTYLTAPAFAVSMFLPAWVLGGLWLACAWMIGILGGFLMFSLTHHAVHHWRAQGFWLKRRKYWHALHHHVGFEGCYGVTTSAWDYVFGTTAQPPLAVRAGASGPAMRPGRGDPQL